jgi:hypothetical protein
MVILIKEFEAERKTWYRYHGNDIIAKKKSNVKKEFSGSEKSSDIFWAIDAAGEIFDELLSQKIVPYTLSNYFLE